MVLDYKNQTSSPKALKPLFCSDSVYMHLREVAELSGARLQCLIKGTTQHMHHPIRQLPLTPNLNCLRSDAKRFEIRASHIPFLNAEKTDSSWWETWICLPFSFLDYKRLPHKVITLWSFEGKLIASFIITYAPWQLCEPSSVCIQVSKKHRNNCECCPTQVTWKIKF